MASLASLVSLGSSTGVCSSSHFEGTTLLLVPRISFPRGRSVCGRRWRCLTVPVCRYSVTTPATDYVADQGSTTTSSSSSPTGSISLDSTYGGTTGEDAADLVLKPSPKPAPKPAVKPVVKSVNSSTWVPVKFGAKPLVDEKSDDAGERNKVIESLGEVLEKAEKLESASFSKSSSKKESGSANKPSALRPPTGTKAPTRNGKLVNSKLGRKPNASNPTTLKSVWRKGSPVTSAPVPVKDSSSRVNGNKVEKEKPKNELPVKVESHTPVSPRPAQPPLRAQPTLQARPSAAPPPLVKRPVVLRDVGAQTLKPQVTDETDMTLKPKERKPILIDKYASKKRVVDPAIAKAVIAPPKPTRSTNLGKFKDGYRKKGAPDKGTRRRMLKDDVEIPEDEAAELNVSIPGATTAKKGRKWHKARRKAVRLQAAKEAAPVKVEILEVGEKGMSTEELANNLAISQGEILGSLYAKGIKLDGVQTLDKEIVKVICKDYEVEAIDADPVKVEETARKKEFLDEDDLDKLEERAPVLTIMGHVDHGKTTLLDSIRKSKVAASEAGGITQGIGAYKVLVPIDGKPQLCVFLDTPGHEAFGAMRARGARVTDIAIIVVAADDGLQPQTNEAIAHAKAAGVPIIVAINKIDKDGANPQRVMQELSSIGLMPEEWGGDIPIVQISALKGENVDELLETVMLVAELQELKANPHRLAKGTVIEAGLHKSKGPIATFIVQNGTLKRGDVVVCGGTFGKVRALSDDVGNRTDEAGPSMPAQVVGLNDVPVAGDVFEVVESLHVARTKAEVRAESIRSEQISAKAGGARVTLSSLAFASSGKQSGLDLHQLNIILKVDVQGSIEAVRQALQVLPQDNVILKFLLEATGDVNSSDVDLAIVSKSIILGFNVKAPAPVKSLGERKGVEIRIYRVIYELIDDVRAAMEGLLETVEEQVPIGTANVRATFSSGSGRVAGCMVTEGKIQKGCGIRVIRNRTTVHVGDLTSLRRVKEIVKEVPAGLECGIGLEDYDNWEVGDTLEAFNRVQKDRTLEEAAASMAVASEGCREQT